MLLEREFSISTFGSAALAPFLLSFNHTNHSFHLEENIHTTKPNRKLEPKYNYFYSPLYPIQSKSTLCTVRRV